MIELEGVGFSWPDGPPVIEDLTLRVEPGEKLVVLGDFNIAPADEDVHDPEKWGDAILCSPKERAALGSLLELGLTDVFRRL